MLSRESDVKRPVGKIDSLQKITQSPDELLVEIISFEKPEDWDLEFLMYLFKREKNTLWNLFLQLIGLKSEDDRNSSFYAVLGRVVGRSESVETALKMTENINNFLSEDKKMSRGDRRANLEIYKNQALMNAVYSENIEVLKVLLKEFPLSGDNLKEIYRVAQDHNLEESVNALREYMFKKYY